MNFIQADKSSGYEVSQHFQRKVNRRLLPDYFDVIKEPMAFSTIRVSGLVLRDPVDIILSLR